MSEQDKTREEQIREIAKKTVRYRMAGTDDVVVRNITYNTGHEDLAMDIYYPSQPAGAARLPVALIPFGYADPEGHIRTFGPVTSWARLTAASGIATAIYGTRAPAENIHAALAHLRTNAMGLNLDAQRIGLFASSGNVPVALSALMRDAGIRCAALLCGYTLDLDGSTAVADMARQVLFADACSGRSVADLPDGVPMLVVRAGRDQFPGLNAALDKVIAGVLARNLPLTVVNYATGGHGFEFEEDTEMSREVIRQVLAFLRFHLKAMG